MKTVIRVDGMLVVAPETELEAYALTQWSKRNFGEGYETRFPEIKIIVDLSGWPEDRDFRNKARGVSL